MSQQDLPNPEQEADEQTEEQQPDAIQLLAERLQSIESALGVGGSKPGESNLLGRLSAIEQAIAKPERERNLPKQITWQEAGSVQFLRKHGIDLSDISSGRVEVVTGEG